MARLAAFLVRICARIYVAKRIFLVFRSASADFYCAAYRANSTQRTGLKAELE
jgi:hypothetical protein